MFSYFSIKPASVAQLDARPAGDQEITGSIPAGFGTFCHSFVEIDHEIFSAVFLSLPLKGSCQFLEKECAQILVKHKYWLKASRTMPVQKKCSYVN